MEIKLASAYLSLGALNGELLNVIASEALDAGMYSDSLAILASETNTTLRDHEELFIQCLKEQGLEVMPQPEAALFIAKHHAMNIVNGSITPYEGAKAIITDVVYNIDPVPQEINAFVGPEDQYCDFSDHVRLDYYGKEYCEKVRNNMKIEITKAAKLLIGKNA